MKTARTATARTVSNIFNKVSGFLSQTIEVDVNTLVLFVMWIFTSIAVIL